MKCHHPALFESYTSMRPLRWTVKPEPETPDPLSSYPEPGTLSVFCHCQQFSSQTAPICPHVAPSTFLTHFLPMTYEKSPPYEKGYFGPKRSKTPPKRSTCHPKTSKGGHNWSRFCIRKATLPPQYANYKTRATPKQANENSGNLEPIRPHKVLYTRKQERL